MNDQYSQETSVAGLVAILDSENRPFNLNPGYFGGTIGLVAREGDYAGFSQICHAYARYAERARLRSRRLRIFVLSNLESACKYADGEYFAETPVVGEAQKMLTKWKAANEEKIPKSVK